MLSERVHVLEGSFETGFKGVAQGLFPESRQKLKGLFPEDVRCLNLPLSSHSVCRSSEKKLPCMGRSSCLSAQASLRPAKTFSSVSMLRIDTDLQQVEMPMIPLHLEACSAPASTCCSPVAAKKRSSKNRTSLLDGDSLDMFLRQAEEMQSPHTLKMALSSNELACKRPKDAGFEMIIGSRRYSDVSSLTTAASDGDHSCARGDSIDDLWAAPAHFPFPRSRESGPGGLS